MKADRVVLPIDIMPVIASMKCTGIKTREGNYKGNPVLSGTIELECNYNCGDKLKEYADASPFGKLELSIDNPEALKQFTPGKFYTIKIEELDIS